MFKRENNMKCKQLINLSKESSKIPAAAFDNDECVYMPVNTSKVHYSARLKRLKVTHHKSEKTLDCQCCSWKITCIHNAMEICYLTQCNMISRNHLHELTEEIEQCDSDWDRE